MEEREMGVDSLFSEVYTLFEYNVSTILSPIVGPICVKPGAGKGKGRSRLESTCWWHQNAR